MASQSIWGSTDRGPVLGTFRIPVDTSAASTPGYITPAELMTFLGIGVGRTVTAAGAVTMTNADNIVNINKTVGATTAVTGPPTPTAWVTYTVKDAKGDAGTHPITITPASGTIDGAASYTVANNFDSVDFYSDGTNLFTK